jgi:hypothetical protein
LKPPFLPTENLIKIYNLLLQKLKPDIFMVPPGKKHTDTTHGNQSGTSVCRYSKQDFLLRFEWQLPRQGGTMTQWRQMRIEELFQEELLRVTSAVN